MVGGMAGGSSAGGGVGGCGSGGDPMGGGVDGWVDKRAMATIQSWTLGAVVLV